MSSKLNIKHLQKTADEFKAALELAFEAGFDYANSDKMANIIPLSFEQWYNEKFTHINKGDKGTITWQ